MRRWSLLRRGFTPVAGLVFGLAGAASAQNLEAVFSTLTIHREEDVGFEFIEEVRVTGTGITSATITPAGGTAILLEPNGADFVHRKEATVESELDLLGENDEAFTLTLNGGARTATIEYARPAIPSPGVSEPEPDAVLLPGPVEVRFTACPICTAPDGVVAELEEGSSVIATENLRSVDDEWTPPDAGDPDLDLELDEDSSFTARVTHRASASVTLPGADPFTVTSTLIHSDEVSFTTGLSAPQGSFCIVANETDPPTLDPDGTCIGLVAVDLGIIDLDETLSTTVGGVDVELEPLVRASGRLTGIARADLDGDGSMETVTQLQGNMFGTAQRLHRRMVFRLVDRTRQDRLGVRIRDVLSISDGLVTHIERARGKLDGAKVNEEVQTLGPLLEETLGWRLDFELVGGGRVQGASLRLENGRVIRLRGTVHFNADRDLTMMNLASTGADRGVFVWIRRMVVDDTTTTITSGDLSYRILGQRGSTPIP